MQNAVILSVDAVNGNADGRLIAAALSSNSAAVKYYAQENQISGTFVGYTGVLLLNSAGKVLGFLPDAACDAVVTIQKADATALAMGDLIYYDAASRTLRASDRRVTGYLEAASPYIDSAETIKVSGCEIPVLEAAWDALEACSLKDRITVMLTDDGKVAAISKDSGMETEMVGVLSSDGKSVALLGSGLTLTAAEVKVQAELYGKLVKVQVYQDSLYCSEYASANAGVLNIAAGTLGKYVLAPVCEIYENVRDGYVYSLSGEKGKPSYDFSEIIWTETIPASRVSSYHLNSAGQVDMILLSDVTGNAYTYGTVEKKYDKEGINLGVSSINSYNAAAVLTNSSNQAGSKKYLCAWYISNDADYVGIALGGFDGTYEKVTAVSELQKVKELNADALWLMNDSWYADTGEYMIPVAENVQVYVRGQWMSGSDGIREAVAADASMDLYYNRSVSEGVQIRIIVVDN